MGKRRTHLNLHERHIEWARRENKNLSAEVRDLLDQRMND